MNKSGEWISEIVLFKSDVKQSTVEKLLEYPTFYFISCFYFVIAIKKIINK